MQSNNNRDFLNNTGKGIYWLFGGKNFEAYNIATAVILPIVRIGSIGAKLYLRKKMQLWAISPLFLIFHFLIIYLIVYFSSDLPTDKSDSFFNILRMSDPFIFYYFIGILLLATIHFAYFRRDENEVSYDSGLGIQHIFWKGGEVQKKFLRLVDPFILAIGVCMFITIKGGENLLYVVWVSCFCLLIEEVVLIYRDWDRLRRVKDTEIEAKRLGDRLKKRSSDDNTYRARSAQD